MRGWLLVTVAGWALAIPAEAQLHPRPAREPIARALDPRFEALVPPGAALEKIVDGRE